MSFTNHCNIGVIPINYFNNNSLCIGGNRLKCGFVSYLKSISSEFCETHLTKLTGGIHEASRICNNSDAGVAGFHI